MPFILIGCTREPDPALVLPTRSSNPTFSSTQAPQQWTPPALDMFPDLGSYPSVRVERVWDGDTVLLTDGRKVRLLGIDCPERDQPFYALARDYLLREVEGKTLTLVPAPRTHDRYGRTLAFLFIDEGEQTLKSRLINLKLIDAGLAYVTIYAEDELPYESVFVDVQREAVDAKRGLWGSPAPGPGVGIVSGPHSHRFHREDCPFVGKIPEGSRVRYRHIYDAIREGKSPCAECNPWP